MHSDWKRHLSSWRQFIKLQYINLVNVFYNLTKKNSWQPTWRHLQSKDVSHSSKRHAKRSTVNMDDVKLSLRRNPALLRKLNEKAEELKKKPRRG